MGLHFAGNPMNVDALGYLKPTIIDPASSHIMSRIDPGMKAGKDTDQKIKLQSASNCWI